MPHNLIKWFINSGKRPAICFYPFHDLYYRKYRSQTPPISLKCIGRNDSTCCS
jgi:pyruvate-formate lyase-activating enzyme